MKANFYNMIFIEDNFLPFHRPGIPVILQEQQVFINGLGKNRIFIEPQEINDLDELSEKFKNYSPHDPWVGVEKGEYYLYRTQINEDNLCFEKCVTENVYLLINTKADDSVTVLNGKIFFRNYMDEEQTVLIKFEENTMVTVEKDEGLIMIEMVNGNFVCR